VSGLIAVLVAAVVLPLLVDEFKAWCPTLAAQLVRLAARVLPAKQRQRWTEEWLAELDQIPGDLSKLVFAGGVAIRAVWQIRTLLVRLGRIGGHYASRASSQQVRARSEAMDNRRGFAVRLGLYSGIAVGGLFGIGVALFFALVVFVPFGTLEFTLILGAAGALLGGLFMGAAGALGANRLFRLSGGERERNRAGEPGEGRPLS
jgi:hypothetical protein